MRLLPPCLSIAALLLSTLAYAQPSQRPTAGPARDTSEEIAATGINLEGVEYPFPVDYFEFESQRQPMRMAYMDVPPPAGVEANGRTVVLLHGKNFNGDYWGQTAGDLAAAGFRVVVPDQIGFGKSTKPPHYQFTFHALADNTLALLDSIGVESFDLVGHSMGGMLATRLALMKPERVDRLALVNPIGLEDWKRVVPYRPVEAWYENELNRSYEGIRQYQLENYYDGEWQPAYERPVRLLAGMTQSPDWPRMAWVQALTYEMIFTQPVVYEFPQLEVPTLLIIGTRDRTALGKDLVSDEVRATMGRYDRLGERAAEAIPDARLVEMEDVGHLPMLEAYDAYLRSLLGFLDAR